MFVPTTVKVCSGMVPEVAAGTPVVCYERPFDGVAFYLQLEHMPAYAAENRNALIDDLTSKPLEDTKLEFLRRIISQVGLRIDARLQTIGSDDL